MKDTEGDQVRTTKYETPRHEHLRTLKVPPSPQHSPQSCVLRQSQFREVIVNKYCYVFTDRRHSRLHHDDHDLLR